MILNQITAYPTSKSSEAVQLGGEFEITAKVLNGRRKIIEVSTGNTYWIPKDTELTEVDPVKKFFESNSTRPSIDTESVKAFFNADSSMNSLLPVDNKSTSSRTTIQHVVKRGETIQSIASYYGVPIHRVMSAAHNSLLVIGQRIVIALED